MFVAHVVNTAKRAAGLNQSLKGEEASRSSENQEEPLEFL